MTTTKRTLFVLTVAVWTVLAAIGGFLVDLPASLQGLRMLVPALALSPVLFVLGRLGTRLWVVALCYVAFFVEYLLVYNGLDKSSGINEFSAGGLLAVLLYAMLLGALNLLPCAIVFLVAWATRQRAKQPTS